MFTLAVKQHFIAHHFLIGGDWGAENEKHDHNYEVEVRLEGERLNEHGYLVDITIIKDNLVRLVDYYHHQTLNELPEFSGINHSVEHFARVFSLGLTGRLDKTNLSSVTVKVWEDSQAWAEFRQEC
jgi:6-pyruvoyltetrahydropterin/6-carboxytetrahydropterin synthase